MMMRPIILSLLAASTVGFGPVLVPRRDVTGVTKIQAKESNEMPIEEPLETEISSDDTLMNEAESLDDAPFDVEDEGTSDKSSTELPSFTSSESLDDVTSVTEIKAEESNEMPMEEPLEAEISSDDTLMHEVESLDDAPFDVEDEGTSDKSSTELPSFTSSESLDDVTSVTEIKAEESNEMPIEEPLETEISSDDTLMHEVESLDDAPFDVEDEGTSDKSSTELPSFTSSESLDEPLMTLLQIAASTGRGEFATEVQKETAASLIRALEAQNPTPEPAKSALANGRWELLYSSTQLFRSSPFFMAGRAVCSTSEQAKQYDWFCDMHRKALAISSIGQVRQIISPTRMTSEFEVTVGAIPFLSDFSPFAYSGGWPVTIEGAIVSSADISASESGDSWELHMDTVEIKGSNIPGLRQILDQGLKLSSRELGDFLETNVDGYSNPRPVFDITYLSKNLRISREQDGKVFVYGKMTDETQPSDYSNVEADLGVLKLLEGFNDSVTKFYL